MKLAQAKKMNRKSAAGATRKKPAAKRNAKSSAWINPLLILLAVSAVLTLSVKAFITLNAIPVEHIVVSGKLRHTNTAALEEMIRPALVGGFLNADLNRVRAQLESLPWIYEVSVRRRWPNALELHVVEQLPIARWGEDGFLNHEGLVFQSGEERADWSALPLLIGPQGTAVKLMAIYQQMKQILSRQDLFIETLAIDDRGQLEATLLGGIHLVLGGENLVGRLRRFVEIYNTGLASEEREVARVDLRYHNGVAIAFRETGRVAGI